MMASCQRYVGIGALLIICISLVAENGVNAFELAGYCRQLCFRGRGGNLCKCNAVHFAGKRGGEDYFDQSLDGEYLQATETAPSVGDEENQLGEDERTLYERLRGMSGEQGQPSSRLEVALAALQAERGSKARTLKLVLSLLAGDDQKSGIRSRDASWESM